MTRFDSLIELCNEHLVWTVLVVIIFPFLLFLPVILVILDETDK